MEKDVFRIDEVKVVKVIHVKCARGSGTEEDPVRFINQYWDLKGNFLLERSIKKMIIRTTKELRKYLQEKHNMPFSDGCLRRLRKQNKIPFANPLPRVYLYDSEKIDAWLKGEWEDEKLDTKNNKVGLRVVK